MGKAPSAERKAYKESKQNAAGSWQPKGRERQEAEGSEQ